jgi:hypothetical protein
MKSDKSTMIPIVIILLMEGYILARLYYEEKNKLFGNTEQFKKKELKNEKN